MSESSTTSGPRFVPGESTVDYIRALADDSPGPIRVLVQVLARGSDIDPDAALGSVASLFELDQLGIYGERIWMLYKDVCGGDLVLMLGLLRGVQLGIIPREVLDHAIDNRGEGINADEILTKVRGELSRFGREGTEKDSDSTISG